jgi:tetratricopeptide (TPR) repeat protein
MSTGSSTGSGTASSRSAGDHGPLPVGANFGTRYHIIRLLGAGGMGAVYQAWDQVLEVAVAVKVIRPMASLDQEATQSVERRFKRELLLARSVTHRNVVRIHDLGEIDGITYITMPYVQGSDLATILRREGRLPVDRVLSIARQVASGLAAAHKAGVVHRDLKPANIMVEADGEALIMDFGIARSSTMEGTMTATGAIVGTIEYMAPEQARAGTVDQRADIYAFGLILNDMLVGRRQTGGATAVAELMSRMQQVLPPVRSIDPTIPAAVDALITKCIQPDADARFQSMGEVLVELDQMGSDGHSIPGLSTQTGPVMPVTGTTGVAIPAPRRTIKPLWIAAALVLVAAAAGAIWRFGLQPGRPAETAPGGPAISLAILPFRNASGDPTLDSLASSLDQVLSTELGQSPHVRTVSSDRLHQVLQDLRISPNAALAPAELIRVADFTNARRVLWGQYTRFGDAIRIDATLQDLDRGQSVPLNAMAPNEGALLGSLSQLAEAVRQDLARGSPDILKELKSTSWKPSTTSFEALRLYNEGMRLTQQGSHQEALKSLEAATKQDANFALGFSALARTYATLGYDDQATQYSRKALSLSESLPPQEKYLIAASHYRIVNDIPKAIESYENLVKAAPNNAMVQFDLGGLYEASGQFEQAQTHFTKVVELDPKFVEGLLALGRVEIRRGKFEDSLQHLNGALTIAIQLNREEARGNILQAIGIAYKRLDKPEEALRHYQQSLEIKQKLDNKRGMAGSLGEIAQVQERLGKLREAEQSYNAALKLQREIGDKAGTATSLVNLASLTNERLGRPDEALPLLKEALNLRRDAGNPGAEALVLNNIGNVYLAKGDYSEAQTYFERTLEIREKTKVPGELADTLHNLGETFAKMGRFDLSLQRYVRALELRRESGDKRGAAIESYGTGTVFDFQGRYGAAVKAKEDALNAYRESKVRDVWLAEMLAGYGYSLSLSGRTADAAKPLDEALELARSLQNPTLIAQALRFQTERLYYAGDLKGAAAMADQAVQAASKASDKALGLLAQTDVALITAATQPSKPLAAKLATLSQEADSLGLKTVAVEGSIARAQVLTKLGDRAGAKQEIDRSVARAEALGSRLLTAKAHYQRAEVLQLGRDPEARKEYALVLRLLNDIKSEDGGQSVLKRADVSAMYADAERLSKGT